MQTTSTKSGKRTYQKKRLLTQDELWKLIIPLLWVDFIHYFLPEWVDQIDFSRKPEFLDKDLKRLMPRGKSKNRRVDILMRVYLKDGSRKSFLFHIEVQAYYELLFPARVFQYFYRIKDFFQEPIETLVIMIDDDPNYRPNEYFERFGQTTVHFKYPLFKLLDNPPPYRENNIFSIILEVTWYALERNMLKNDEDLEKLKYRLLRQLVSKKIEPEKIYAIFEFINIYLPFGNSDKDVIFVKNFDNLINKEIIMEPMTMREYLDREYDFLFRQKAKRMAKEMAEEMVATNGKEIAEKLAVKKAKKLAKAMAQDMAQDMAQGMAQGMAQDMAQDMANKMAIEEQKKTIRNLYAKGFSIEDIVEVVMKPKAFVLEALEK